MYDVDQGPLYLVSRVVIMLSGIEFLKNVILNVGIFHNMKRSAS